MAHKVVDHRLILSPEAELDGQTQASVTDTLISQDSRAERGLQGREMMTAQE